MMIFLNDNTMKRIEDMTESELVEFGRNAKAVQARVKSWIDGKNWPQDKVRQYYLTKCMEHYPLLEKAIQKARELYRTKFKR